MCWFCSKHSAAFLSLPALPCPHSASLYPPSLPLHSALLCTVLSSSLIQSLSFSLSLFIVYRRSPGALRCAAGEQGGRKGRGGGGKTGQGCRIGRLACALSPSRRSRLPCIPHVPGIHLISSVSPSDSHTSLPPFSCAVRTSRSSVSSAVV